MALSKEAISIKKYLALYGLTATQAESRRNNVAYSKSWLNSGIWATPRRASTIRGKFKTGLAELVTREAAPTGGVVDDTANTFNWTNKTGYTTLSAYEYTLNGGTSYATVTAKPIVVGNVAKAIGQVGVRLKATATEPASATLFNTTAFTVT